MERRDARRADRELSRAALFIETPRCLLIIARAQSEKISSMPPPLPSETLGNVFPAAFSKLKRFAHAARH